MINNNENDGYFLGKVGQNWLKKHGQNLIKSWSKHEPFLKLLTGSVMKGHTRINSSQLR
jgi:hypothetical protein